MSQPPPRIARKDVFDHSYSGAQDRPWIPRLRSDPLSHTILPNTLLEFREQEGSTVRERHFRELWKQLPKSASHPLDHEQPKRNTTARSDAVNLSKDEAKRLEQQYEDELMGRCHGSMGPNRSNIRWEEFRQYAEAKEAGKSPSVYGILYTVYLNL
jgi:solute carrier family 25 phosphate transporter 23/24/25/41